MAAIVKRDEPVHFLKGWMTDSYIKGERPSFTPPADAPPETTTESMEVSTSFMCPPLKHT